METHGMIWNEINEDREYSKTLIKHYNLCSVNIVRIHIILI